MRPGAYRARARAFALAVVLTVASTTAVAQGGPPAPSPSAPASPGAASPAAAPGAAAATPAAAPGAAAATPAGATPGAPPPKPPPPGPEDAAHALALATYAFEYRDFARVITTLDPWVHPPRIAERARLADAQRLLGISLHIQGEAARAEAEFAALLQFDPELRLDPFVVPPAVVDTFERLRASMRPVLDRILAERRQAAGVAPPPALAPPVAARALSPVFAYAPLGLSHFLALDQPGWGALFLGLQAAGLSANAGGYWYARGLRDDQGNIASDDVGARDVARAVQLGGLALFAAAWIASGLHAHGEWPTGTGGSTGAAGPAAP